MVAQGSGVDGRRRARSGDSAFADLLQAATEGEPWALDALARTCLDDLTGFAQRRGAKEPAAIANLVVMEFVRRLDALHFETPGQMWAYLYRIARSRIIDERRGLKPVEFYGLSPASGLEAEDQFEDTIVEEAYVGELLSDLTVEQREVVEMRFVDDMSLEETANRTGRTLTAVKGLQRRGLRNLLASVAVLALVVAASVWALVRSGDDRMIIGDGLDPAGGGSVTTPAPLTDSAEEESAPDDVGSSLADLVEGAATSQATTTTITSTIPEAASGADTSPETSPGTSPGTSVPDAFPPGTVFSCGGVSGTSAEIRAQGYDVFIGTDGDDTVDVAQGDRPDFVVTFDGNDTVITGSGDDLVCSGDGNDTVWTGPGRDRIWAAGGNDSVRPGSGDDQAFLGGGNDTFDGGDGDDVVNGEAGIDVLDGGAGADTINGGASFDVVIGGPGPDSCDTGIGGGRREPDCERAG